MEHHPLGNCDDGFLRLVKSRELCLDGVVGVSHYEKSLAI